MPDILHQFSVKGTIADVFRAVSSPEAINVWWTNSCSGEPIEGSEYELFFGPGYDWRAVVSKCIPDETFELTVTSADEDWTGLRVGFELSENNDAVRVRFYNSGWAEAGEHFRISNFCWAMYLRLLKRYVEYGEVVPYEDRLTA